MVTGFLNLYKPKGITAHDCVSRLRKLLSQKKIGHSGTLDPAATGVLPIAVGKATRLLQFLPSGKAYKAKIKFGLVTTTDDLEGKVINAKVSSHLNLADVEVVLPQFVGSIEQRPPAFSAIQVQGVRLYELARAGKAVEAPLRTVKIKEINILSWYPSEYPELDLEIICSGGTYIRSIARDLGQILGCGATLAALERTVSNEFHVADSWTLEDIAAGQYQMISPAIALKHLPEVQLEADLVKRWQQGQAISTEALESSELEILAASDVPFYARVSDMSEEFLGICKLEPNSLQPVVVFN